MTNEEKISYLTVGNDELGGQPDISLENEGRLIMCTRCNSSHPLLFGINKETGEKTNDIGAINCPKEGKTYLVVVGGKLLPHESWAVTKDVER